MRKYIMISKYMSRLLLHAKSFLAFFNDIVARVFPYYLWNQILITKVESNQGGI